MTLRPDDYLIDVDSPLNTDALFLPVVNGEPKGRGAVPRDYSKYPKEMFAPPSEAKLIPKSEWSDRIKDMEKLRASISHIRDIMADGSPKPSLDQGQVGYCWGHSVTQCCELDRGMRGQPYKPLSAYSVCSIIKKGRDEGGWCGLAADFIEKNGVATQASWPQGNRSYSQLDTPQMREEMKKHRITESWIDLTRDVYDRNLTFEQLVTFLLSGLPCAVDFNWWGHSVCAMDVVEVEPGSFGIRILNSWSDQWGTRGTSVLRGSKAVPDGAICVRATAMSA